MDMHGSGGDEELEHPGKELSESEVEEMQRKNCVFCHIASGRVPARKVYEDEQCIAVLDINPANPGHILLMPKEHFTVMFQLPEELLGHVFIIAKSLSQAGLKAFQSTGTTIFAANGVAAGQRAPHFMLHVIPRLPGDNIGIYIPSRALPAKEAEQIALALSAALGGKANAPSIETAKSSGHEKKVVEAEIVKEKPLGNVEKEVKKEHKEPQKGKTDLDAITDFLAKSGEGK